MEVELGAKKLFISSCCDCAPKILGLHDCFHIYSVRRSTACVPGLGYLQEHQNISLSLAFLYQLLPDLIHCLQNEF